MRNLTWVALILLPFCLGSGAFAQASSAKDQCYTCHAGLGDQLQKPADVYVKDVHSRVGLTCASCHGGDATSDDPEKAMSKQAGFIGVPKRSAIPSSLASVMAMRNI